MSNRMIGYAVTYTIPNGDVLVVGICSGGSHEDIKRRARGESPSFKIHRIFSKASLDNWDKKIGKAL
jgi:hypothetical protein